MKRAFLKLLYQIYIRFIGIIKPISIGVRVLLVQDDKVLMVKHSYQDEWFFVGGGVKRGETLEEAARREAKEEAGATLRKLEFFGIYTNYIFLRTDHIAVFLSEDFTFSREKDWEIEKLELFPFDELPGNIAPGIKHRLDDYLAGTKPQKGFGRW
jgi:8-oxo-dGTP pyrophosphatase MutT (NUDIX family)